MPTRAKVRTVKAKEVNAGPWRWVPLAQKNVTSGSARWPVFQRNTRVSAPLLVARNILAVEKDTRADARALRGRLVKRFRSGAGRGGRHVARDSLETVQIRG